MPNAKRQALATGISARKLLKVAQAAKEDPDSFSRWKLDGEHKQAEVCLRQVQVPPLDGKAPICVWLVDVAHSLNYYIRNSQEFADLLRHAAAQTPAKPALCAI